MTEDDRLHAQMAASRPTWDDYFLGLAFAASRRSHDQHTRHGTVLVDPRNHRVLALGFNGFPRGMDDAGLPLTRPEKYAWMEHSEVNALANLTKDPWDISGGPVAYVTGQPCFECSRALCRHNVLRWVLADRRGYTASFEPAEQDRFDRLVRERGVHLTRLRPDLQWLVDAAFTAELRDHGFLGDNHGGPLDLRPGDEPGFLGLDLREAGGRPGERDGGVAAGRGAVGRRRLQRAGARCLRGLLALLGSLAE